MEKTNSAEKKLHWILSREAGERTFSEVPDTKDIDETDKEAEHGSITSLVLGLRTDFRPGSGPHQQMDQKPTYIVVPESDQNSRSGDLDGDGDTAGWGSMWCDKHQTPRLTLVPVKNIHSVLLGIRREGATHIEVIL